MSQGPNPHEAEKPRPNQQQFSGDLHTGDNTNITANQAGRDVVTHNYYSPQGLDEAVATGGSKLAGEDGLGLLSASVPSLPIKFLSRSEKVERLKQLILCQSGREESSCILGICGMGGLGKSVLAVELTEDEAIRRQFSDGIVWVTLGQSPSILDKQAGVFTALTLLTKGFSSVEQGKELLQVLFNNKACLLILDDVWKLEHANAFNVVGKHSQILITTRDTKVIENLGGTPFQMGFLEHQEALELLAKASEQVAETLPNTARDVAKECGNLPLALAMVGAMAKGDSSLWDDLLELLKGADLAEVEAEFVDYRYPNLLKAMKVSVDALDEEEPAYYLDFAIFPEDIPVPSSVLKTLWKAKGLKTIKQKKLIDRLVDRSLARQDEQKRLTLHDLQLDYVRKTVGSELPALHERLLDAYQAECPDGWHTHEADGYFFEWLAYHLQQSGRTKELQDLLLDYRWLLAKLRNSSVNSLIADYDRLPDNPTLKLVQGALRLSMHMLSRDPTQTQLPGQLLGRLMGMASSHGELRSLLEQANQERSFNWLCPLTANLTAPGGAELLTLAGHERWVNSVVLTSDDNRAVSTSDDNTLKVWELATGQCLHTLAGHESEVNSVVLTSDDNRAVSTSYDKTLKVWELATGQCLHTLAGHESEVNSVVLTSDDNRAVSTSYDNTLKVWELATGQCLHTLAGHESEVKSVVLTSDDNRAVSTSGDKTLKVWELATGQCLHTLAGHESWVKSVVLTSDDNRAVSTSGDNTLKVWELATGQCLHTLSGHEFFYHNSLGQVSLLWC